jgi:hypothetical protein
MWEGVSRVRKTERWKGDRIRGSPITSVVWLSLAMWLCNFLAYTQGSTTAYSTKILPPPLPSHAPPHLEPPSAPTTTWSPDALLLLLQLRLHLGKAHAGADQSPDRGVNTGRSTLDRWSSSRQVGKRERSGERDTRGGGRGRWGGWRRQRRSKRGGCRHRQKSSALVVVNLILVSSSENKIYIFLGMSLIFEIITLLNPRINLGKCKSPSQVEYFNPGAPILTQGA